MDCYLCGKNFLILNKFIFHLEYMHNVQNNYICPIMHCRRSFHKKYVYKNHIRVKHNMFVTSRNDNNLSQTNNDSKKCIPDPCECSSAVKSFHNETETLENIQQDSTFDIQSEFKAFTNILHSSVVQLIGKFNSIMSLNRSIIQELIDNLITFLSSGFIDILINCVDHALKKQNTDTYTINIKSKINTMMLMLTTIFKDFATDYKRFKYFISHENFIQPIEHIVGIITDECRKSNEISMVLKNRTAIYISIKKI